jgi:hypothetical protein
MSNSLIPQSLWCTAWCTEAILDKSCVQPILAYMGKSGYYQSLFGVHSLYTSSFQKEIDINTSESI